MTWGSLVTGQVKRLPGRRLQIERSVAVNVQKTNLRGEMRENVQTGN